MRYDGIRFDIMRHDQTRQDLFKGDTMTYYFSSIKPGDILTRRSNHEMCMLLDIIKDNVTRRYRFYGFDVMYSGMRGMFEFEDNARHNVQT